jgi:hypothetical protein
MTGVPNTTGSTKGRTYFLQFDKGKHDAGKWHFKGSDEMLPGCDPAKD